MHYGMMEDLGWEDPSALWEDLVWEDSKALWDAGGPGVGGPHGIVECWRAQGGKAPMHCGMLEDPMGLWDAGGPHGTVGCWRTLGWEDPNALWDDGGPWSGRTPWDCGMLEDQGWEDPNALWDAGGPQCIVGCRRTPWTVGC